MNGMDGTFGVKRATRYSGDDALKRCSTTDPLTALTLSYVIECCTDWIAEVKFVDGKNRKNNRRARVFVSKNPGVATLMELASERGTLEIKSLRVGY